MKGGERRRKEGGDQRCNNTNDALFQQLTVALKGEALQETGKPTFIGCSKFYIFKKMSNKTPVKHHKNHALHPTGLLY